MNILPTLSLYVIAFLRLLPIFSRFGSSVSELRSYNPSVKLLNNEINKLDKYSKIIKKSDRNEINSLDFSNDIELRDLTLNTQMETEDIRKI